MKLVIAAASLGLFIMALSPMAAAQPATQQQEQSSAEAIATARSAVTQIDVNRVLDDRAYAVQVLGHLDVLANAPEVYSVSARGIEMLRLIALASLGRADEVRAMLDRFLAMRPEQPSDYAGALYATLAIEDFGRYAAVVEAASRNVRASGWADLRGLLDRDSTWPVLQRLRQSDPPARVRLANALFRIGWRSGQTDSGDGLRLILLTDAMDRGDQREAREYASGITAPSSLAPLLILKRHDGLLPDNGDRLAPLREALATQEQATAEAMARDGDNLELRLDRIQHLRALGRNAEALALAQAQLSDPTSAARTSEHGMWIANEAAYALLDLGRPENAARVLRGLTDLPIAEHNYLVSSIINHGEILAQAGLHAESLDHARRLERELGEHASEYGVMWIRATIVCALARLERAAEAEPTLAAMRAAQAVNAAALMRSYLCLNDLDAAEQLMISRLASDDPEEAVMSLQDYALEPRPDALVDRLLAVRARPNVRAALERVARLVELPLARTYWGGF